MGVLMGGVDLLELGCARCGEAGGVSVLMEETIVSAPHRPDRRRRIGATGRASSFGIRI